MNTGGSMSTFAKAALVVGVIALIVLVIEFAALLARVPADLDTDLDTGPVHVVVDNSPVSRSDPGVPSSNQP
jgi:hypothetical protein